MRSKKGELSLEHCDAFCSKTYAKSHCRNSKCRSCSFCNASAVRVVSQEQQVLLEQAERRQRGRALTASWCDAALMRTPAHLFRRMWAADSWAANGPGDAACWERQRDAPRQRLPPGTFFQQAEAGSFCKSNWYEGHSGSLGQAGRLPKFAKPAPALLGYDEGILDRCRNSVPNDGMRASSCRNGQFGHVARCCTAAGFNILNMIGHRTPYNLCRNLEWQMCAILGKLPGQPARDRTIRFANAPSSIEVEPVALKHRWGGQEARECGRLPTTLRNTGTIAYVASNGTVARRPRAYTISDIFHLEVCLFNQVCSNGHALFELKVDEPFVCEFSHARFEALAKVLLATPPVAAFTEGCRLSSHV